MALSEARSSLLPGREEPASPHPLTPSPRTTEPLLATLGLSVSLRGRGGTCLPVPLFPLTSIGTGSFRQVAAVHGLPHEPRWYAPWSGPAVRRLNTHDCQPIMPASGRSRCRLPAWRDARP